jgi:hypothetical protein
MGALREILIGEIERFHDSGFVEDWQLAKSAAEDRVAEIADGIIARHVSDLAPLEERLTDLRRQTADLVAEITACNDAISAELNEEAPSLEEFGFPDSPDADEWEDPLFDSLRSYVEQVDRFKSHQGKPIGFKCERNASGVCPQCGVTFSGKFAHAKYCSTLCQQRAASERAQPRKTLTRAVVCAQCGAPLPDGRLLNAKYCSQRCNSRAYQLRKKAKRA